MAVRTALSGNAASAQGVFMYVHAHVHGHGHVHAGSRCRAMRASAIARVRPSTPRLLSRAYTADAPPRHMQLTSAKDLVGRVRELRGQLQPKLDGWRFFADLQTQTMYSRGGTQYVVPHLAASFERLHRVCPPQLRWLDGELCHPDGRQAVENALRCTEDARLCFHAFDVVLEAEAFSQRYAHLQTLLLSDSDETAVRLVPACPFDWSEGEDLSARLQENALLLQRNAYDGRHLHHEGLVLRLDEYPLHGPEVGTGYNVSGRRSWCALKHKPREIHEFKILVCQGSEGRLDSLRLARRGRGRLQRYFTAKVHSEWDDERRRKEWERRKLYAAKHNDSGQPFQPQYVAMVESDGLDKGGRPMGSYCVVDFRHKDDLPVSEWPASAIKEEFAELLFRNFGVSSGGELPQLVQEALEKVRGAKHHSKVTRAKHKQMLTRFTDEWGEDGMVAILRQALHFAHLQSHGKLLEFYCNGVDLRLQACPAIGDLIGCGKEGRDTRFCVYVYSWPVTSQLVESLAQAEVSPGSKAATSLQSQCSERLSNATGAPWRSLSYVGMTTSSTVKERHELDGYESNVLMHRAWALDSPEVAVAFASRDVTSGPVIEVLEFMYVELLGTYGTGFNQQPGGPFNYSTKLWATYKEFKQHVLRLGIESPSEYLDWCRTSPSKRERLSVPYNPNLAYKHCGWQGWRALLGLSEEEYKARARLQCKRGNDAAAQKLVDSGEAATIEEARSLRAKRGNVAAVQKLVDSGEAATIEEARSLWAKRGNVAAAQKLVDSGEAATIEEARRQHGKRNFDMAAQKLVDSGEAATVEEGRRLWMKRARDAAVQKLVDSGEAATIEEARSLSAKRASDAAAQTRREHKEGIAVQKY